MRSFKNHVDPQKEEQLQLQKIEIENQVKRITKLTKTINHGNKEANLKKKSELIHLIEDFNQRYESLYSLYADLKDEVKKNFDYHHSSSSSSLDSENYYSPEEDSSWGSGRGVVFGSKPEEDFDLEHMILKDKLTCSSEVKDLIDNNNNVVFVRELITDVEDKELLSHTRTKELEAKIIGLKNECDALSSDKQRLECEAIKMSEKISSLEECVLGLEAKIPSHDEQERVVVNDQMKGLETEIEKTNNELERYQEKDEDRCLKAKVKDLESEIVSLNRRNEDLESEVVKKEEKIKYKISQLEKSHSDREREVSLLRKKLKSQLQLSNSKIESLEKALGFERGEKSSLQEQLRVVEQEKNNLSLAKSRTDRRNAELTDKIADQQKTLIELGTAMSKLKQENERAQIVRSVSRSDFRIVERKIEETAEEFRKQLEDKHRMLSRRIRVAEQLQIENKEWYRASKERHDRETKDLLTGLKNIKALSLSANETLAGLDSKLTMLEERRSNLLNRVSKASCELKFTKDWVRRKSEALARARGDLDRAVERVDEKESEILGFREWAWRRKSRVRELEKMVKERDDAMMGLEEEKREAIRQLCVWIDYQRGRSDYYMKALSESRVVARKKTN